MQFGRKSEELYYQIEHLKDLLADEIEGVRGKVADELISASLCSSCKIMQISTKLLRQLKMKLINLEFFLTSTR